MRSTLLLLVIFFVLAPSSIVMAQTTPLNSGVFHANESFTSRPEAIEKKQILKGSTIDLAFIDVHIITLPAGGALLDQQHSDLEEMLILKEGRLQVTLGMAQHDVGPGSVVLALPGETHHYQNAGNTPAMVYVFQYKGKRPADLLRGQEHGGSFVVNWEALEDKSHSKGSRRNLFERPTAIFNRFEMHVTTLNAGLTSHDPHQHRPGEFILVHQGEVEEFIDNQLHPASSGDLLFLESQSLHTITNRGTGATTYYAFQFQ